LAIIDAYDINKKPLSSHNYLPYKLWNNYVCTNIYTTYKLTVSNPAYAIFGLSGNVPIHLITPCLAGSPYCTVHPISNLCGFCRDQELAF